MYEPTDSLPSADSGVGFSIDRLPHAAVSNPEDKPFEHVKYRTEHGIRAGGFGILMTRELVDDLLYNEKGNEVLLIKYLSPQTQSATAGSNQA